MHLTLRHHGQAPPLHAHGQAPPPAPALACAWTSRASRTATRMMRCRSWARGRARHGSAARPTPPSSGPRGEGAKHSLACSSSSSRSSCSSSPQPTSASCSYTSSRGWQQQQQEQQEQQQQEQQRRGQTPPSHPFPPRIAIGARAQSAWTPSPT